MSNETHISISSEHGDTNLIIFQKSSNCRCLLRLIKEKNGKEIITKIYLDKKSAQLIIWYLKNQFYK